jgi:LysR family carnitine catabolism transcriptional activator
VGSTDRHYFKELRLQQFRALVSVARSGSFSVAARELGLTKASVWQQVRALEEEFSCALVEVLGRRVLPTPEGIRLVALASPLVESFDSIKQAFASDLLQSPATLSVATTPSCLAHELPAAVRATREAFPQAQLSFFDRNSPDAISLLESGQADLAVAARFEEWPSKPTLDFLPLSEHPFALGAPKDHPLLRQPTLRLSDLPRFPLLLPAPSANCRPRLERLLRQAGVWEKLSIVLECSFPGSLLEYVEAGLGITLTPVPPSLLLSVEGRNTLPGKQTSLRSLEELLGTEPVFLIRRRGWMETPIASFFRKNLLPTSVSSSLAVNTRVSASPCPPHPSSP